MSVSLSGYRRQVGRLEIERLALLKRKSLLMRFGLTLALGIWGSCKMSSLPVYQDSKESASLGVSCSGSLFWQAGRSSSDGCQGNAQKS